MSAVIFIGAMFGLAGIVLLLTAIAEFFVRRRCRIENERRLAEWRRQCADARATHSRPPFPPMRIDCGRP